jgi:hypothetical protein
LTGQCGSQKYNSAALRPVKLISVKELTNGKR